MNPLFFLSGATTFQTGNKEKPQSLARQNISQSFIPKFWAGPPAERNELSMPHFQIRQKKVVCGCHIPAAVCLHIHVAVQVVIWAEKYLWPLQLSAHFALHLAHAVPTPVPLKKDTVFFFFCIPIYPPSVTPNTSLLRCQETQIKSGLNKICLHLCMQEWTDPSRSALTFLWGDGTPLKDYLSGSGLH